MSARERASLFTLNQAKRAKANPSQVKPKKLSEYHASQASKEVKKQAKHSEQAGKQASERPRERPTYQPTYQATKQVMQA